MNRRAAALATVVAGLALGALFSLRPAPTPPPAPSPSPALALENAALRARVSELEALLAQATRDAERARSAEPAPPPPPPVPAAAPKPAPPAPPPSDVAGWVALARELGGDGAPPGLAAWLKEDPKRAAALLAALGEVDDPAVAARLTRALGDAGAHTWPETQRALLALADSSAPPAARAQALALLARALAEDALAGERLGPAGRQALAALARTGPPEVRHQAVRALVPLAADPVATEAFLAVWRDPALPEDARNQAVLGLRFAPEDTAFPALVAALTSDGVPTPVRQQAAVSLAYLNPRAHGEAAFTALAEVAPREPDWLARGFSLVALIQLDHARAAALIADYAARETDPWERERYERLAEIATREQDYQRVVTQGIQAFREIEARKQAAAAGGS